MLCFIDYRERSDPWCTPGVCGGRIGVSVWFGVSVLVEVEAKGCCFRGSLGPPVVSQMRAEPTATQIPASTRLWRNFKLPYVRLDVLLRLFDWMLLLLLDGECIFVGIYRCVIPDHHAVSYHVFVSSRLSVLAI